MSLGEAVHSCQAGFPIPAKTAGCKCLVKDGCLPHPSRHTRARRQPHRQQSFLPSAVKKVADSLPKVRKCMVDKSMCTWLRPFNSQWCKTNAKRISIHSGISPFQTFDFVWILSLCYTRLKLSSRRQKSLILATLWKQHQVFNSE